MKLVKISWRNLWRNSTRTNVTITAVALCIAILIIFQSLIIGLIGKAVHNTTNLVVGEVQIHAIGYLDDRSIYKSLKNVDKIRAVAKENNIGMVERSYGFGLISSGTKSAGTQFWGIDPESELKYFDFANHIDEGNFLTKTSLKKVVLGNKLARSLAAELGTELVIFVQGADGSLGNELFYVTGILGNVADNIDRGAAIILRDDFDILFSTNNLIHEIALNSNGKLEAEEIQKLMSAKAAGVAVETWKELMPTIAIMTEKMSVFMLTMFSLIFTIAASLGVMNTLVMSTYDRMKEFGIIRAIGATPWLIIRQVSLEAILLTFLASIIGTVIGLSIAIYLQVYGIDISGKGNLAFGGIVFDPIWRASVSLKSVFLPVVLMMLTSIVASIYPASIAARIKPVEAIHYKP
ncbi:MAG: ABC transporter permease [Pelagibacteraceae bacterium]|jgi:ABC-type lipoprotein release transport system permease subunit|nr:ABC transporter permease [Pelagibacteraceae bacterium]MBT4645002.1 ABC transporter permease [Pelagibacteraceae bacterium]MBT4950846.1 ABC transporter permease [Pelagibacteraceae bacterium]MBT5213200.1 ABC transporter permease [Pelagibacteraceae bacterium]MBT6354917.1 ABC transporter permease [Pelagibacteraceae bacterium]